MGLLPNLIEINPLITVTVSLHSYTHNSYTWYEKNRVG